MTAEVFTDVHPVSDDGDDDAVCAICFEHRSFVNLPCSCRINYCATCWDRALATSVSIRGRAHCPTCRTELRIDFNQAAGCLVFSRAEGSPTISDWRAHVYGKARPVQIQLLKDFGTRLKSCSVTKARWECTTVAPVSWKDDDLLLAKKPGENPAGFQPLCICGATLEKISSRARIIRMLDDTEPAWRSTALEAERLIDSLVSRSLITCDLCNGNATRTGAVWTCSNGPHTMLHLVAYDVCEQCFLQYTGSGSVAGADSSARMPQRACTKRCIVSCISILNFKSWRRCRAQRAAAEDTGSAHGAANDEGVSTEL